MNHEVWITAVESHQVSKRGEFHLMQVTLHTLNSSQLQDFVFPIGQGIINQLPGETENFWHDYAH